MPASQLDHQGEPSRSNRVSVSLNAQLYKQLQELSQKEGRSVSNLCAHLLATALERLKAEE